MLAGQKILVTGASGTIGQLLASHLAGANEVWGIARFASAAEHGKEAYDELVAPERRALSPRAALEAAGVTTHAIDIGSGDLAELPDDFTHVLHLAWMRADLIHLQDAIRSNVEGAGFVLQHCRNAKAALVMSGMGIYSPHPDPWHLFTESDPIGRAATAYAPTSPASKAGLEAVTRFCARAFDLPVVLTRLNTFMGTPASFPATHIDAVLQGRTMVAPHDPNPHSPIHIDDMLDQLEALLDAAATPAHITNWCGDEVVTSQSWTSRASELAGRPAELQVHEVPGSPIGSAADATRRRSITGPCRTRFADTFDRLYEQVVATAGP